MTRLPKVLVIGLDGLEPGIVEPMIEAGELPNLRAIRSRGGYARVATTLPAQTPVAWSTFATGVNPGGHGIFDFIRRDPLTYLPDLSLNRYEQKNAFLPPKAVNLRLGTPVWELLATAGVPSAVIRCPCTYPPDTLKGRMLSGMGVPDLRGGLGTSTFYSTAEGLRAQESENAVAVAFDEERRLRTHVIGPRNPKTGEDAKFEITVEVDPDRRLVIIHSAGQPNELEVREGSWSEWLHVKFKLGILQSVTGAVRFFLPRVEQVFELYASPVNFSASAPMFPISAPWEYAGELERRLGTYYTTGMVEDHTGLNNGRFDEATYLDQCAQVMREREAMLSAELERFDEGLLFCLFDTPDRLQHMFWRFREPGHPANARHGGGEYSRAIEDHYRQCDAVVGRALGRVDDQTLVLVLSDHGFGSFRRGVHLNSWLHAQGLLALRPGVVPGEEAGDLLRQVDWSHTRAYALGLGSIYLNQRGREAQGIVAPEEARAVARAIVEGLTGLPDPSRGEVAVRGVALREEVYAGACATNAPDLIVRFNRGYRASWGTALGAVPHGLFEDNLKRWSGDHIVDPALVPGVLFANRPFRGEGARLLDLAPTILAALGVPKGPSMEGESLIA